MDMTEELEELRAPLEEVLLDSDRANGVMRCVEEIVSDITVCLYSCIVSGEKGFR